MRTLLVGLTASLVLVAAACGDDGPRAEGDWAVSVEGVEWQLVDLPGTELPDGVTPTLMLESGSATGTGGCNNFTGDYQYDGTTLTFGPLGATRMACVPDVAEVEFAYFAALEQVAGADVTGSRLTLTSAAGDDLATFESAG